MFVSDLLGVDDRPQLISERHELPLLLLLTLFHLQTHQSSPESRSSTVAELIQANRLLFPSFKHSYFFLAYIKLFWITLRSYFEIKATCVESWNYDKLSHDWLSGDHVPWWKKYYYLSNRQQYNNVEILHSIFYFSKSTEVLPSEYTYSTLCRMSQFTLTYFNFWCIIAYITLM